METATQTGPNAAFALGFMQLLTYSIAQEMQTTRKVIAAIPEDKKSYRPDPKSKTAAELAWHLVGAECKLLESIAEMNFAMGDRYGQMPDTIAGILAWYDENGKRALARVQAMTPTQLMTPVDFYGVLNLPAFNYLMVVNNHTVHHRGQLSTYLRPMGAKVPSIYGGSADEPFKG